MKPLRVAEESARATTPTKVSIPSINQTNISARNSGAPLAENANSPTVLEKPTEGAERNMSEKDSLEEMERLGLIMPNLFTADDLVKPTLQNSMENIISVIFKKKAGEGVRHILFR